MNVLLNAAVSATFSKPMNPVTITAPGTFTLAVAGVGGAAVTGTVTYDSVNQIATFTPAANLTATTQYTATITNAATDLAGNPLVAGIAPNPWSFTTGAATGPIGPNLGTASTFGSIGGAAGITNQGLNTVINGDIGTTGASTVVTGFHDAGARMHLYRNPAQRRNGERQYLHGSAASRWNMSRRKRHHVRNRNSSVERRECRFHQSLSCLATRRHRSGAGQLGGLTLPPGIYKAAGGSFMITGADLTLDGQGDSNAIWVFQMASTLLDGDPDAPHVILTNGAQAKNVFWQVGSSATIKTLRWRDHGGHDHRFRWSHFLHRRQCNDYELSMAERWDSMPR